MLRSIIIPVLIACTGAGIAGEAGARPERAGGGNRLHGDEVHRAEPARGTDAARDHLRGALARHHLLMLAKFDADGDRRLSEAERATAKAWFEQQRTERKDERNDERKDERKERHGPEAGVDADDAAAAATALGAGKDDESARRHLRGVLLRTHLLMLDRFDADKDGRLSDGERATAKAWFDEQRAAHKARRTDGKDDGPGGSLNREERTALKRFLPDGT